MSYDERTVLMNKNIAIKVNELTKKYKLYDKAIDRLKESVHPLRKKYNHEFFALNDISFEIKKGETVGIVGRNGSGKSTLLKIITGVLTPTSGQVEVNGKIAALLELGAGFNPEFTGIENIYLNGAIMGYRKDEIDARLDSILGFADIGDFVHQPVKTYSSGMLVRLAFAVQVQVEPDILIVDEALAVGDALFQKRCFQKMERLTANGTTLLFVSHEQESVRTMTNRAILLADGTIKVSGTSADVLLEYRKMLHEDEKAYFHHVTTQLNTKVKGGASNEADSTLKEKKVGSDQRSFGDLDAEILEVKVMDVNNEEKTCFYPSELVKINVTCQVRKKIKNLNVALRLRNKEGIKMYSWGTLNQDIAIWSGNAIGDIFWDKEFVAGEMIHVSFEFECNLGGNLYEIQAAISEELDRYYGSQRMLHWRDEVAFFHVNLNPREYFFGGICDMKMRAIVNA